MDMDHLSLPAPGPPLRPGGPPNASVWARSTFLGAPASTPSSTWNAWIQFRSMGVSCSIGKKPGPSV
eukprot:8914207-Pyramimonas_sp.AAC.1